MNIVKRSRRKSGGWVTKGTSVGPVLFERTVSFQDPARRHAWTVRLGGVEIRQGWPGAPVFLNVHHPRAHLSVLLRGGSR